MRGELLHRLHAAIDTVPRGRADLLARSGLAESDWRPTVTALIECGAVIQQGDRKGARYVRGRGRVPNSNRAAAPTPAIESRAHRTEAPVDVLEALLAATDGVPRPRAELTERAGIDPDDWAAAIWTLHQAGAVFKVGDRGGARYFRAPGGVDGQAVVAHPVAVSSPVRQSAHDDVEDIFRELGAFDGVGRAEVESAKSSPPVQLPLGLSRLVGSKSAAGAHGQPASGARDIGRAEPKPLVSRGMARVGPSTAPPRPQNWAPGGIVVVGRREKPDPAQPYEAIDKRSSGGCLWIIDGPEAREYVKKVNLEGADFVLAAGGGRATNGRRAWWTKNAQFTPMPNTVTHREATVVVYSMEYGRSAEHFGRMKVLVDAELRLPGSISWRPALPFAVPGTSEQTPLGLDTMAKAIAAFLCYAVHPYQVRPAVDWWVPDRAVFEAACKHFGFDLERPRRAIGTEESDFVGGTHYGVLSTSS